MGNILIATDKLLSDIKPDAVLVLGDTNSCISILAAKKRKISTFHFEAGNRCFDFRVPEEINRKIVDHIADINLTYSSIARDYLKNSSLDSDQVKKFKIGYIEKNPNFFEKLKNKFKIMISIHTV